MASYNNEQMLKVLIQSDLLMIKAIIKEFQLHLNQSFIKTLMNEFNYLANISTQDIKKKFAIKYKLNQLKLIDSLL